MIYLNKLTKDTTIYEARPASNTGLDAILEIGKENEGTASMRSLLHFDVPVNVTGSAKYELTLHVARAAYLKVGQQIEVCVVNQEWSEGQGYLHMTPVYDPDGATWNQSNTGGPWASGSFTPMVTATLGLVTPLFDGDISINIKPIIDYWASGVPNRGILIKFPDADEADPSNHGFVRVFSRQTHTIYRPNMVTKWDDQIYTPGPNPFPTNAIMVFAKPNISYKVGEVAKIEVGIREKYPQKTFTQVHERYTGNKHLPETSYFSIIDDMSETVIIPFSNESKISSVDDVNFFKFHVEHMYPHRYYRIMIKVKRGDDEQIFDNSTIFSVK